MRLVAWNCCQAFHRKFAPLEALKPDIAVISECADLDILRDKAPLFAPENAVWIGDLPNKGLGIFAFNGYRVTLAENYDPSIKYVAPVRVIGDTSFNLLAVWAQNNSDNQRRKDMPGPLLRAIDIYENFIDTAPTITAGDFNNHVLWDKPGYAINHANTVTRFDGLGMVSAYHADRGVDQGDETEPTHYWRDRKKDGPTYHIDYIFMPRDWVGRMQEMTVGTFENWCGNKLSDHVPLVIDVETIGENAEA